MRPRLNLSLRRALMAAMATACTLLSTTAWGGVMHDDVSFQTYTDFGQNRGRYVVGSQVNELLSYIRSDVDKGIVIHYQAGGSYTISNEQGMINFGGTHDQGHSAVISPTFIATVFHNGSLNASVGERWVGASHAINYDGVDIRGSNVFRLAPDNGNGVEYDYMIQRQSKIVTDATWNTLTTLTSTEINNLDGSYIYHSGSGTQYVWLEEEGRMKSLCGAYQYIIGAINTITNGQIHGNTTNLSLHQQPDYSNGGDADTNTKNPLPNGIRAGDSGSPTYIYNTQTGQYEYIAAQQSGGGSSYGQARGDVEWTNTTLESFNARVDLSATNTVQLNAISITDAEADHIVDNLGNSTQIYHGVATDADGNEIASYRGIQSGVNTWGDLSGIKNNDTWYAYGSSYLKQKDADLFFNDNLVFTATNGNEYSIVLNDTVDLGVGYVEFNKGEGDWEKGVFTITSEEGENNRLNSAGFVINEDAEVHLRVNNPDTHMTEWRKNGAGNLYIDGTGDTNALLTVGGSGTTYLQQTGGYAAYNVLASSGATVVIKDLAQIERDFTFGVGGGVLDMNGNDMDWYTSTDGEGRFTIHALTEEAIITNSSSTAVNLTYKESGNQTFKGSFVADSGKSLNITYDGGGTWTLNSIHTRLSANSLFTVNNGTVILKGTNTVHGLGSTNGLPSGGRLNNPNDWHYADATMDVTVANGATFELGSHARLTGMVYVENGGTFVLREGVKHRYEYVEGGAVKEDTYKYAQFYGLHNTTSYGVYLGGSDASMQVAFSEGTTANTTIAAKLYGKGSISVAAGTAGGSLTLTGDNSGLSGTKTLISGGLIADTNKSLGNTTTNKWVVNQEAWIASHEFTSADNIFTHIDASSTGTLALSNDIASQLSELSGTHKNMTLGAEVGKTVNYGTAGTSDTLTAVDGVWKLGGGGGELVVNFVLAGDNTLMLGNHAAAQGTVTLTNNNADFSGDIIFSGTGITLKATNDNAFGSAKVALDYGNVLALDSVSNYGLIKDGSTGVLALASSQDVDLSAHAVTLGALGEVEYAGSLSATKDGSYRIGGSGHLIFTNQNTFSASNQMYIDGQGLSGSAVTFARANAYTGNIVAGGGLQLASVNSSGDVTIHLGHRDSLASASSVLLQKGASLQFDALATATVQNLSVQSGASLVNNGFDDTTVTLNVTDTHRSSIVSSALSGNKIHLVKTGAGTLYMSSTQGELWTGGLTIREGIVEADIHANGWTNYGGIGSADNVVRVEAGATLKLNAEARYGYNLTGTSLPQKLVGSGTIELSSGGAVLFGNAKSDFDGTIKLSGGTRLYVGSTLAMNGDTIRYNNLPAINGTTVEVEEGSQVRVTSSLQYLTNTMVTTDADFIISGQGYTGNDSSQQKAPLSNDGLNGYKNLLIQADLHGGALSIDAASTVTGNITLATDAAIASWSGGQLVESSTVSGWARPCTTSASTCSYRLKGRLGGTVRGLILGVEQADGSMSDLTLLGNETLTFTADSANTYGDLLVAMDGNGNEDDKVALKLDGGASLSQTSTALGTGSVTLNDGLILRLAGTGVENNSDVVYTYENNMSVGAGATLQSYNITNRLTGTVAMSGNSLNLATARGGVLELAGGISGSGTLNVAAGSKVILGSASAGYALARTGTPQFSGTVAAGDGADITLASPAVVAADTAFTGTDNLTLRFSGTEDFTLGSISMTGETSTLNLNFDFSAVPDAADAATWNTLTVTNGITADSTTIGLTLNVDNDIASGSYALISGVSSTEGYSLADTLSGRLSLATEGGNLVLVVDADGRLYWRSSGENWNTSEAHWYQQALGDTLTTFSSGADVVFDASGVAQDNSAATPEQVVLNESVSVGKMSVKEAAYTISGTGAVAGQSLVVSGGAEAILNLSAESGSSFTAGVTIDDATLTLQGTSLAAAATVQNGGTLALNSAAKLTGNVIVESGARFTADAATLTGNLTVREADAVLSNASTVSGNVTVREGNITIDGSRVTGSFSGVGKGSAVLTNATLTTSGGWVFSELKNKFTLSAAASGTISWDVANGYLTLDSLTTTGNLSTTNDATAAGEMVFLGTSSIGRLEGKMGTLTIGLDADHTAFLTVTSAEFSDNDNKGAVTLNINEGSTFKVTSTGTQGSNTYQNNGIRIGEWNSATTVNVDGALLAANSSLHVGDRTSYVNIGSTGVLAVKGIRNGRTDRTTGVVLTMEAGGKLIVGSENVATNGAFTATLNGGTIASSADATTINGAFTANGSLEIDTNRYDFAEDGNSIARGTTASTITMQGSLSGECALTVSGSGKLALQNDGSAFTGSIALKDTATLSVNSTSAGILSGVSSLAVNSGTLDLSALDFNTETQPTIALSAEASFSFTENSTVAFGTMHEDTWYSVFDTNAYGAALDGWESLSVSNFAINGVSMADMGRITLTTVEAGGLFYYTIDRYDLVWNGGATGTWNSVKDNAAWLVMQDGTVTDTATHFVNNDNVTFNSSASLQVADGVIVNNVTIEGNSTVTLDGAALTADKVTIESGSKLKGAYASVLVPVKTFDIAAGATLEMNVPGGPTYTAEVTGEGAVTMTGGGTLTWNAADGSLSIGELNITGGGTFKTTSAYTGTTVNITNGSAQFDGDVSIDTMNVAAGKTVTLWNAAAASGADKNISTLHLANGAKLQTNDRAAVTAATTIGTLNLTGSSATLQDVHHSGYIAVDTLKMGDGVASATLTLKKLASSSNLTTFELGAAVADAGNFAGTIELLGAMTVNNNSGSRSAGIVLSNGKIAQNAVVSLGANNSTLADSVQVLGINAENTTIAGLVSRSNEADRSIVFSGALAADKAWSAQTKAATPNTLTINTSNGATHEYYGQVQNVNLVIDGEGTQKFLGTSNSFSGSVTVQGGTAAFNAAGTSLLEHATAFTLTDGVLDLSAITFGTDSTNAISLASGATYSFSDGVIDLGNLDADTTYQIFDLSAENTTLSGWDSETTLGLGNFRINGALLADTDGFVAISLGADGTFRYTMTNPEENPLYWSGGSSADWNTTDANWDATPEVADDGLVEFRDKSAVVFASSATVNITEEVEAYSVIITDGAEVKLTMGANGGLATGEVVVDAGTLELGSDKNWQHLSYVTVGEEGVLRLMYGVGINNTQDATDIFLNGGKIELRNGAGANQVLHADMVVDGSGTIAGSRNGDGTTISGTISGNGTLTFEADSGHNNWMTVSSIVSDGEDGTLALHVKDAQIKLTNAANSYTGATTIDTNGKLVLDANATYTLGGTVSGAGTLEVAAGTTLKVANDKTISSALLVNGGVVDVTANNNKVMAGNITVQNGGELKFTYSGGSNQYDCFAIDSTARTITLDNGTLDLGAMRHTMQNWSITMSNGSLLKGTGSSYNITGKSYTAALDVATNNMTISSTSGDNEISAVTRLRTNTLKYNVTGGTLTISGEIMSDGNNPAIVKEGSGDLIFTRDHTFAGTTTISAGKLVLNLGTVTTGEGENAVTTNGIYTLDGAVSGAGTLQVMGGTTVVADAAAETISTAVILEKGSVLKLANGTTNTLSKDVTKGTSGAGTLEVAENTTLANNGKVISADLVLNGGDATITGGSTLSGDVTIKNGSTLTINTTDSSDHFEYGHAHTMIVEEGGTLALGSNRETFGNWTLDVQGGIVTGSGANGDVGQAALDYNNDSTIKASAGNGEIAAAIGVRSSKTLSVNVDDAAGLEVSGTIVGAGSLKKATGTGTLVLSGNNTYTGTTTVEAGTLELQGAGQVGKGNVSIAAGGAELAAATTATQEAESEVWASITSTSDTAAATVSGATITQTEDTKTLAVASRSTDGTRGTLENTLVQIASGATLTVDSMMISPGSRISGAASLYAARAAESSLAQVQLSNSILQLDTSNSSVAGDHVTMDLGTLQATGSSDASGALTLGAASKVLTVSTDVFSNLALTSGTNFVVDFSSLLSSIDVADADFVYLSFADTVSADWSTTTLTGTWNDYQMAAYYHTAVATGAAVPNVGVYFDVRSIPEPTSTTLSILALAALAARRRRK